MKKIITILSISLLVGATSFADENQDIDTFIAKKYCDEDTTVSAPQSEVVVVPVPSEEKPVLRSVAIDDVDEDDDDWDDWDDWDENDWDDEDED